MEGGMTEFSGRAAHPDGDGSGARGLLPVVVGNSQLGGAVGGLQPEGWKGVDVVG